MSYLWYKKFLLDRNINKPLVAIFDAAISSDKSPDYTEISKRIKDTELFKDLYTRMGGYSKDSQEELFNEGHDVNTTKLFVDRVFIIMDTITSL